MGNTGFTGAPLARMDQMVVVGVFGVLIAEITNQEALEWIQANQKRLDETVASAVPEVVRITRQYAPQKTGLLRKGIIAMPGLEKTRYKGKSVGEVVMDNRMNSVFQKPAKKGRHYYYPASQEYGFKHRIRGGGVGRVEGQHFMHIASRIYAGRLESRVVGMVADLFSEL